MSRVAVPAGPVPGPAGAGTAAGTGPGEEVIAVSGMRTVARGAASLVRRLGLDASPLRRRMDRAEAWIRIGLVALFLIGAPLVAVGVGRWTSTSMTRAAQTQTSADHQVQATLLADAPADASYSVHGGTTPVKAAWTAPGGAPRSGEVQAPPGARKGAAVTIWVDGAGHITDPPLTRGQVTGQVITAATLGVIGFGLAVAMTLGLVHRVLERRRLADWEASWSAVEPLWTRRLH